MTNVNIKNPINIIECNTSYAVALPQQDVQLQLPIHVNGLTLDAEAAKIKQFHCEIQQEHRNLTEKKTALWTKLGRMLNHHKKRVEDLEIKWTEYAVKKFPWLKERRRQQCMALARWGDRMRPYYHMGIDRSYDLFNKLKYHHLNDPDFDYIRSRYRYIFDPAIKSLPDKEDVKVKADVIRNFFKFKNQVKRNDYDKDFVLDVLETGCTFNTKDYEYLRQPLVNSGDIVLYLLQTMVTASPPASQKSSSNSKISIQVILSQLLEMATKYNADDIIPDYLNVEFLDTIIGQLTTLRDRMGNPSNAQEVS